LLLAVVVLVVVEAVERLAHAPMVAEAVAVVVQDMQLLLKTTL